MNFENSCFGMSFVEYDCELEIFTNNRQRVNILQNSPRQLLEI